MARSSWNTYKQVSPLSGVNIYGAQQFRGGVSNWTIHGFYPGGNTADLLFMRVETTLLNASGTLRAIEAICANADTINIGTLETFLFNTIGKGHSTITLMRGGEVKCEWLATDIVTNARALQVEFQGLSTPSNPVYGLWFESDSATGAMAALFYEIRMKTGLCIISGSGVPSLTAPKGSLFLRTDGTSTSTRAYINTDGAATWTAITTAG